MARVAAIKIALRQGICTAPKGMNDQGQRHLIQPWVKRLTGQFGQIPIADGAGIFRKPRPEFWGGSVIEKPCVEVGIMPPIIGRMGGVHGLSHVQIKQPIERAPDARIIRPVKRWFGPCAADTQRGGGAVEIKGNIAQLARDQRVTVKEDERPPIGQGV